MSDVLTLVLNYRIEIALILTTLVVLWRLMSGKKAPSEKVAGVTDPVASPAVVASASTPAAVLSPTDWRKVKLVHKEVVNHNTNLYRFALPSKDAVLNLPVGKHIKFGIPDAETGKMIQRAYTPVSLPDQRGSFDLIIKVYPKGVLGQHIDHMAIGDEIDVRGPHGLMKYTPNMKKHIGMIAGGSGITPMLQMARWISTSPEEKTQASLVFANIGEQDILCHKELDELANKPGSSFKVYYVLQEPPADWTMGTGFVNQDIIKPQLPPPSPDTLILLCGPPPMLEAMQKHLAALGYTKDMIFQY